MKTKKPWQRGFIPPRPVKHEPKVPTGWTRSYEEAGTTAAIDDGTDHQRSYYWAGNKRFGGPRAFIRGTIGGKWAIWYKPTPWNGSLPSEGVFRQPDMRAGSLEALAVWWEIEQENLPQLAWDPAANGTVTGRHVGKMVAHSMSYGMGATSFQQIAARAMRELKHDAVAVGNALHELMADALRHQTFSDPRLMEPMDFAELETRLSGKEFDYVVIHDEVVTYVQQSNDRAADRQPGDQ